MKARPLARDFFDPTPEQQNVILIQAVILRKAEKLIESCEHCNAHGDETVLLQYRERQTGELA